jgi:hypothetical protein
MEERFSTKNLATIIKCGGAILLHRLALWAFSYDMGSGSFTDVRGRVDNRTLAEYSKRNEKMLRYRLPKIAEAYIRLGKEERAREVLLELGTSWD